MSHQSDGLCLFLSSLIVSIFIFQKVDFSSRKGNQIQKSSKYSILNKDDDIFPPLPQEVVDLLNISKLCFLATVSGNEPHLSLMNFTYYQPDEVLIFTTRRNTKKFQQIQDCSNVAVLAHDFPHLAQDASSPNSGYSRKWSITLNGIAKCLDDDDPVSIKYRYISFINIFSFLHINCII